MGTRILFHFHTNCSYDARITPGAVVDFAVANNIGVLAPTDHDTIRGALEVRKLAFDEGIRTIIGAEYLSDRGDIIGLFLEEEVIARDAIGIIREIKNQGGLVILPHPFRSQAPGEELLEYIDGIEVFNARLSDELNEDARKLAERKLIPQFYGADAHLERELGLVICEIEEQPGRSLREALLYGMTPIVAQQTSVASMYRSQMIRATHLQRPWLWCTSFAGMIGSGLLRKRP